MKKLRKPCPRCGKRRQQAMVYFVCKPCGIAFDSCGNPAPEGALDIPLSRLPEPKAPAAYVNFLYSAGELSDAVERGEVSLSAANTAVAAAALAMGLCFEEIAHAAWDLVQTRNDRLRRAAQANWQDIRVKERN